MFDDRRFQTILAMLLFLGALLMLQGCLEEKDPASVGIHPSDWSSAGSGNFHGTVLLTKSLSIESCQSCHGADYQGGTSEKSCYSSGCHNVFPHPEGFAMPGDANFHARFIEDVQAWNITECQSCHGTDYAGNGFASKNCLACHKAPDGPEACNLCHGGAANAAPPKDLSGKSGTRNVTVGAHQEHVAGMTWSINQVGKCQGCHQSPSAFGAAGHVDDGTPHSEIIFSALATAQGTRSTTWNRDAASCSDVYCHGGFEFRQADSDFPWAYTGPVMSGNNQTVYWNAVGNGQALCGSCHGLPPVGHIAAQSCEGCHSSVVDANFNIINKNLHINGRVEVFQTPLP